MKHNFIFLFVWGVIVNFCWITECICADSYSDLGDPFSDLVMICEENLDQFSWQTLFQKGKFFEKMALINAKVQEDYIQFILNDVKNLENNIQKVKDKDQYIHNIKIFKERMHYYLGLAFYAQKNWNAAYYAFDKSGNEHLAECMKAACLKQLKKETAYKEMVGRLPDSFKQLCSLRINFLQPFQTKISVTPSNQLGHIETLVWKSCQEDHLNFINEKEILEDKDIVVKLDNNYKVFVFNSLNFYYLSEILLQKAKQLIDNEFLLLNNNQDSTNFLAHSNQIKRYYQKCYCLSDALIYFQEYQNALFLIKYLRNQMKNNSLIKDYLSLIHARCLWEMDQKDEARAELSFLHQQNNNKELLLQLSMFKMKWFPEILSITLKEIKEEYHPKHCNITNSLQWGVSSSAKDSCIPWYHAVGQGYILQGDNQKAMPYYMQGFSTIQKNILSCYSMDYIINLITIAIECKIIDGILQFVLENSKIDDLLPEVRQLKMALGTLKHLQEYR